MKEEEKEKNHANRKGERVMIMSIWEEDKNLSGIRSAERGKGSFSS